MKKKRILLVDDDQDFRFQQRVFLEGAGFEIVEAEGESEAYDLLAGESFDLAVVDLMMENSDGGFTLCYHIKKEHPELPVILVSGVAGEHGFEFDTATQAERSWIKADCFLAKPLRFEQLQYEIDRLLGLDQPHH